MHQLHTYEFHSKNHRFQIEHNCSCAHSPLDILLSQKLIDSLYQSSNIQRETRYPISVQNQRIQYQSTSFFSKSVFSSPYPLKTEQILRKPNIQTNPKKT